MLRTALLLLQAATPADAPAERIDLTVLPGAPRSCAAEAESGDDVVVCGRSAEQYRLKPLPERYAAPAIPRALVSLPGGATAEADATQTAAPDGKPDKRILVTVTIPF